MKLLRIAFLSFIVVLPSLTLALDEAPVSVVGNFSPVDIAISCRADTADSNKEEYPRGVEAGPEVSAAECLDKSKVVQGIFPQSINVEYISQIQQWMVVLALDEKSSERVKVLSSSNLGQKLIISVDRKVLSAETLFAPVRSRMIYINVDSKEAGHKLMLRFMRGKG